MKISSKSLAFLFGSAGLLPPHNGVGIGVGIGVSLVQGHDLGHNYKYDDHWFHGHSYAPTPGATLPPRTRPPRTRPPRTRPPSTMSPKYPHVNTPSPTTNSPPTAPYPPHQPHQHSCPRDQDRFTDPFMGLADPHKQGVVFEENAANALNPNFIYDIDPNSQDNGNDCDHPLNVTASLGMTETGLRAKDNKHVKLQTPIYGYGEGK